MSKRLGLLGMVLGLVLIGLLMACGSSYNASSNGLLVVGSKGSALLETFSFTLNNGHVSGIANTPADTANKTCVLNGLPGSIVIDPAGAYAYAIVEETSSCSGSANGILAFKINSDGTIAQVGNALADPNPMALSMDSSGNFLFVAEGSSTTAIQNAAANKTTCVQTVTQNGVCVYAIGSGANLTAVNSTFTLPPTASAPNFVALATTPTKFPGTGINGTVNSVCSVPGNVPPTSEYLYLVDSVNYQILEFTVDTTKGALAYQNINPKFTGATPAGIAVDPCDRFVYVSNEQTNKINAYTICTSIIVGQCQQADGSLVEIANSPISATSGANGLGPIVVDPNGNNVYVVGTLSNTLSGFKISPVSGSLTAVSPATVATGSGPVSIAIRADDNWLFVANYGLGNLGGSTVSQYSITPATGALSVLPAIQTDNYPWGVAVK